MNNGKVFAVLAAVIGYIAFYIVVVLAIMYVDVAWHFISKFW